MGTGVQTAIATTTVTVTSLLVLRNTRAWNGKRQQDDHADLITSVKTLLFNHWDFGD